MKRALPGGAGVLASLLVAMAMFAPAVWAAEPTSPASYLTPPANGTTSKERLRADTIYQVKSRLMPLLQQYCKDACSLLDVGASIEEAQSESDDLGFEAVVGDDVGAALYVDKIHVELQVDDRITKANRERLVQILQQSLASMGAGVEIIARPVTIPEIGLAAGKEEQLERALEQKLTAAVDKVLESYCPEECVLSSVAVDGRLVSSDQAQGVPSEELVRDKSGGGAILRVEAADISVAMDKVLPQEVRAKIANVIKAKTSFVKPVNLKVSAIAFPESYASKKDREARLAEDPYGLNKLRETLKIFRELAGTKEIVTTTQQTTQSETKAEKEHQSRGEEAKVSPWWIALGGLGFALILGLGIFLAMRLSAANRDARMMIAATELDQKTKPASGEDLAPATNQTNLASPAEARREITQRLRSQELREELIKTFLDQPRVAKETFARLLEEEGVEETASYVHIFGHLVIFELLSDPNLQRSLYELSEFYHKSSFNFSPEDEFRLLTTLKTRATASEIRVLARRQMDKFDFLAKLDPTQVYNLISEEKSRVQSIVLTQLDHKRRRAVFDMYAGDAKVELMRELCRADAIPKEYLHNVAKALHKKVTTRPEYDTENLRSNDILLELMEKADLSEQRELMRNLIATNADTARGIKLKLVTQEIMPYLKDGHLLEIILGLEREELLSFLAGTREHIRGLLLAKAPEELADSWIEDLANVVGFDEQKYRLTEMKILNRIRSLANNGAINLLDINDIIFGVADEKSAAEESPQGQVEMDMSHSLVA